MNFFFFCCCFFLFLSEAVWMKTIRQRDNMFPYELPKPTFSFSLWLSTLEMKPGGIASNRNEHGCNSKESTTTWNRQSKSERPERRRKDSSCWKQFKVAFFHFFSGGIHPHLHHFCWLFDNTIWFSSKYCYLFSCIYALYDRCTHTFYGRLYKCFATYMSINSTFIRIIIMRKLCVYGLGASVLCTASQASLIYLWI